MMKMRWNFPLDPDCPAANEFLTTLYDPMNRVMGAPMDEITEGFSRKHQARCERCREYGVANVEVVEA